MAHDSHMPLSWASAEIFPGGGQRRNFAHPFQVANDAMQMDVHKTLYPFYTKENSYLTTRVTEMCFFGSNSHYPGILRYNLHNRLSADFQSRAVLIKEALPWSLTKPQIVTLFYLTRFVSVTSKQDLSASLRNKICQRLETHWETRTQLCRSWGWRGSSAPRKVLICRKFGQNPWKFEHISVDTFVSYEVINESDWIKEWKSLTLTFFLHKGSLHIID